MQGLWYGDPRDRVKWGALAYIASRFSLRSILQVAYFRDDFERALITDESTHKIADLVWKHFADLTAVERASDVLGVQISAYSEVFEPKKRQEDIDGALRYAEQLTRPRLLFLDPDTGIEPGTLKPEHAALSEIARPSFP